MERRLPPPRGFCCTRISGDLATVIEPGTEEFSGGLALRLAGVRLREPDVEGDAFALLDDAGIVYDLKTAVMTLVTSLHGTALIAALQVLDLPGNLFGALTELVATATGPTHPPSAGL